MEQFVYLSTPNSLSMLTIDKLVHTLNQTVNANNKINLKFSRQLFQSVEDWKHNFPKYSEYMTEYWFTDNDSGFITKGIFNEIALMKSRVSVKLIDHNGKIVDNYTLTAPNEKDWVNYCQVIKDLSVPGLDSK